MTRVVIAVPFANDFCMSDFTLSLAALLGRMAHDSLRRPVDIALIHQSGSLIMDARNSLAQVALDIPGATHVLFLDSDMTFPPDTLQRLLDHKVPIVGADYVRRNALGKLLGVPDLSPHHPNAPALGLTRMLSLPFGVMLIRLDVFRGLPRPWFNYITTDAGTMSEDTYFCHAARRAFYTIWHDPALTKEVGHVGTHIFRPPGVTTHSHRSTLKAPSA